MGLLDAFNSDDGKLGLALLAASGPSMTPMNTAQRIAGAFSTYQAQKESEAERLLKQKYLQSQIDENASQADLRKAQLAQAQQELNMIQSWIGRPTVQAAPQYVPGNGSDAGKIYPTPTPMGPMPDGGMVPEAQAPQQAASKIEQLAQQYNIPLEALNSDLTFNRGKGLAQLIAKAGEDNWVNVNGNLVNTKKPGFAGGLQAGMATSANGQVTAWQPDGRGGLVVGAPSGALETFRAYTQAASDAKPIKVVNADGGEDYTTEGNVVRAASGRASGSGYAGGSAATAAPGQLEIYQQDVARSKQQLAEAVQRGDLNAQARIKRDIEGVEREIGRLRLSPVSASGNYRASLSPAEIARNEAERARLVDTAKADVVRDTDRQAKDQQAKQMTSQVDRAISLLKQGPTQSLTGSLADKGIGLLGMSTSGGNIASKLETLSGWLVSNVPRMEGPQSNFDLENYRTMAGRIGDRTLPIETRLAAAEEVKLLQQKYSDIRNNVVPSESTQMPKPAYRWQDGKLVPVN